MLLFGSCSSDRPPESKISEFVRKTIPPSKDVRNLGTVIQKNAFVEVVNQWNDENLEGVYYVDIEVETHAFKGPHLARYSAEGQKIRSARRIFTCMFQRRGEQWEPQKSPKETKKLRQKGNLM